MNAFYTMGPVRRATTGNLQSQSTTAPSLGTLTQTYSYDCLNRLTGSSENSGAPGRRIIVTIARGTVGWDQVGRRQSI